MPQATTSPASGSLRNQVSQRVAWHTPLPLVCTVPQGGAESRDDAGSYRSSEEAFIGISQLPNQASRKFAWHRSVTKLQHAHRGENQRAPPPELHPGRW